jgi:hypothetical protein
MSFAPLFATLNASASVKALLGSSPLRVYPAGEAPQGVALPYATYQQVTGSPENYLGTTPDADASTTQVDVYAATVSAARSAMVAVRNALEPVAYVVAVREMGRDPKTNNVRVSMDVDWITSR